MPVKKLNPITPSMRFRVQLTHEELTTNRPEKSLVESTSSTGGRNNQGRRTMRNRGGGHKKQYRRIDFLRDKDGIPGKVKTIEYDPNRSAHIALINYADGEKRYIIAPHGLHVGATVLSGKTATPDVGNTLQLGDVPLGSSIHAIELHPGQGACLVRSAGTSATMMGKEDRYASIKMPSGEIRRILTTCRATIGSTSNPDHSLETIGKAGRNRWFGWRPRTRGVAMNPVDHPMGGGEGRASGGHPRSRNGQIAKGAKTRSKTKQSSKLIISRRKTTN
ncbi:MAG: 50S ribosomal protein L2 [Saprospiraceae bacterium]|nr:50S ribosomal protein L2 [Saprospiraceae bacterium]MBK8449320.1 50S ribosomal protein L2 [Saprospiraceae bacterium]MBK8484610.1 50S ribosomal protein L2 [Saprospiraceae bacterium]MBK9222038.1 50S ribosomal protein L2 [Saprospiraceae bacterium]MBK9721052.1 50S ribosomal protein L2 [Saprospiraceae bacterium]